MFEPTSPDSYRPRRPRGRRAHRGILVGLAAVSIIAQAGLLATGGWAAANPRAVTDAVNVAQYDPTPAIAGYATRAGMSERGRYVFYASAPRVVAGDAFDSFCSRDTPDIGVLGCFTLADARIYLYDITNVALADFEVVVAAHEMLHAAWYRLSIDERRALVDPLEQAFATIDQDSELVRRIASYEEFDPTSRIPELYAIVGTEFAEVPDILEAHYATYFDDRAAVVTLWQQVKALFAELEQNLDRLSSTLDELATTINAEQATAEQTAAVLEADIIVFNERARRQGGYSNQSAFERDRQALIDRQAALTAAIDVTTALIAEYNTLLDEFTALNDEAEGLNRDLNINPQPIESIEPAEPAETIESG